MPSAQRANAGHVIDAAQQKDIGGVGTRDGQRPRPAASGQHQSVVGEALTVSQHDGLPHPINAGDAGTAHKLDAMLLEDRRLHDEQLRLLYGAGQIRL